MQNQQIYFPGSKLHYHLLDGLRGIAAVCILIFHFFEYIYPDASINPIGHGYLAVDFFFALSGFVIGYAYDQRINTIGAGNFFRNRLIRLQPMVVFGAVLGLLAYIFNPYMHNVSDAGWMRIIVSFVATVLLIPMAILPNTVDNVFPLNAPTWSLSTEYLANIFYAFVLSRISKKVLLVFFFMSACWLAYIAQQRGWIIMGWSDEYYFDGWARTAFSFIAGLLIFRYNLIIKSKVSGLVLLLMLAAVFFIPHSENDWIKELAIIMILFPLIISISAGTSVNGFVKNLCIFLGRLSYPLYMTHYFVVGIFGSYYTLYKPAGLRLWILVIARMIAIVIFTWLVMRFYDEPVRKYLMQKLVKKNVK